MSCGINAEMLKIDLADAYRQIVVKPSEWFLLGTTIEQDDGSKNYYVDTRLLFGLRSAAKLFDKFASGLGWKYRCH